MSTYGNRLVSFTTAWPHASPSPQDLAGAGFSYRPTSELPDNVICQLCNTQLCDWSPADDPLQEHYRCSKSCMRFASESDPTLIFVQDAMALPQKEAQASALADLPASPQIASSQIASQAPSLKAPQPLPKDIGFLDPSLQHDFPELCLFHDAHVFCDRIELCRLEFGEAAILALLPKCLRGEALKWFNQSECQDLAACLQAMRARFWRQAPPEGPLTAPQAPPQAPLEAPPRAPDYHHCKLCNASFSSMARLIRHAQENICDKPSCRHCDTVFLSRNQLHRHLREECRKQTHRKSSSRSSSLSSPACSPTCSPKSSFRPSPSPLPEENRASVSPSPSPPPKYRTISPPPPIYGNFLTVKDLYARYAPQYLKMDDLFRMFGRRSAPTTKSSAIAAPTTPATSKHPSIRHRGRCHAEKGDGSTKPPKHPPKHLTKQQPNQKTKINFVRTSLQPTPYKSVLPLQRSRSMSCPMAAPGSPSSHTRAPPQSSTPHCIRSPMPHI